MTKDELPDIMAEYGWQDSNCRPTKIITYIKIDGTEWIQNNTITSTTGKLLKCKIEIKDKGTIQWSGYGSSGSSKEQSFVSKGLGTITVKFKNVCGATSSETFNILEEANSSKPTQ